MRKQLALDTKPAGSMTGVTKKLIVLSVSPVEEDHSSLQSVIDHGNSTLFKARDLVSALVLLEEHEVAIVLCERDLLPGTWMDVLEHINGLPGAPSLIVTSRLADDRLWSEALNRGAWDVLAKPFDRTELLRTVKTAWHHWHNAVQASSPSMKAMKAAS